MRRMSVQTYDVGDGVREVTVGMHESELKTELIALI